MHSQETKTPWKTGKKVEFHSTYSHQRQNVKLQPRTYTQLCKHQSHQIGYFSLFALAIIAATGAVGLYIYRKYCINFRKTGPHCSLSLQFSIRQDNVFIKLCSIVAVQEDLIIICKQWIKYQFKQLHQPTTQFCLASKIMEQFYRSSNKSTPIHLSQILGCS